MAEKIKVAEVFGKVTEDSIKAAIGKACGKLKGASSEELAKSFGLSERQYKHFLKAFGITLADNFTAELKEMFSNGHSLEVPHQFQVYVHESESRKNKNGNKSKKISVRTRRELKRHLNQ